MANITFALTKLQVMSGSFVDVPNVTSIGGPNISRDEIEVTNMNSINYREYVGAPLADPGVLDFSLNYVPSNAIHKYLIERASESGSLDSWKLKFSDGTDMEFSGSMLSFSITSENPASNVLTAEASVRLSGEISGSY
jgi:hypothetical protein